MPRLLLSTLVLGLVLSGGGAASAAQPPDADADPAVASGDASLPEHLLGDWGGLRTGLLFKGINLDLGYVSETDAVVSGGRRQGVDYAHSIDLKVDLDMQKLAGLGGFSLHGAVGERAGRDASIDFLREHLNQIQEIYGGAGSVAAHLAYLYAEESLAGGAFDVEAGRMGVGDEFAESPLYCAFTSHADCPAPNDLGITTGFTIYPASTWGGRVKIAPGDGLSLKVGAYQVRPQLGGRGGWNWGASGTTGVIVPVELEWTPWFGPDHLVGHYKLGAAYDTSRYPDLGIVAAPPRQDRGRTAWYVLADQMLKRTGPNGTDGVILMAGYSHSDPNTSVISELFYVSVLANGVVPGRAGDSVGVQVMRFQISHQLIAAQELEFADGLPLTTGLAGGPSPVVPQGMGLAGAPSPVFAQGEQTTIEARYDFRVVEGFHLIPDFQYIIHPNATTLYPDATVIGLKIKLEL